MAEDTATLDDVKVLLGISDDTSGGMQDQLLNQIIKTTTSRLAIKVGQSADKFMDTLGYIVTEVSVVRYNRLSNEGMSQYSQEGLSISFKDDDFSDYLPDIADYKKANGLNTAVVAFVNPYGSDKHEI